VFNPYGIQAVTYALTIAAMIVMAAMALLRVIPWRLTIMPGVLLLQYAVFYTWLLFFRPSGNMAWISALLRFQEVLVFLSFLVAYWYRHGRSSLQVLRDWHHRIRLILWTRHK
jgi:hypothetical protein